MPPPSRPSTLPLFTALAVIAVWGLTFPIQKAVLTHTGANAFVGLRFLIAPVCALALLTWRYGRRWPRLARAEWWRLGGVAFVGQGLHLLFAAHGMAHSTPFSASVLLAVGPVFTLLILRISGLERLGWAQVFGVGLAALGAVLMGSDKLHQGWQASLGDATLLVAAALFSLYTVRSKPLIAQHGGVVVLAYGTLLCTPVLLLFAAPALGALRWEETAPWLWAGLLWNVVVSGFLAWLAWGYANEHWGVARCAPLIYLMPVVAGLASWLWAGETFSAQKLAASAAVLGGVALAQFARR